LLEFAIGDIFGSREFDMIAYCGKKGDPVHKEQVTRECDLLVGGQDRSRDPYIVREYRERTLAGP
jgi:hypothetical protein